MVDLLPCPFCGGEAKLRGNCRDDDLAERGVVCTICHHGGYPKYAFDETAIAAWNRRAPSPAAQDAVERCVCGGRDGWHLASCPRQALSAQPGFVSVPVDVRRLVVAARRVLWEGDATGNELTAELDAASEAFAERVPWENDPNDEATASLCSDCPPVGYPTDKTRCLPCPRRAARPAAAKEP